MQKNISTIHTQLRLGVLLLLGFLLTACSHTPQTNQLNQQAFEPRQAELEDVPFFPQTQYQCGPAALATVMQYRGIDILPEALTDQVYIPERQGSLQIEMVAATRKQGLMPYPLAPNMEDLLTEVAAGNPVLVMQNLGYNWKPFWHYAVVVGFDIDSQELILRSGETKRWQTTLKTFERTWARTEHWALVIVKPENIPPTAQLAAWLQTAYDAEKTGQYSTAESAYRAALEYWPDHKQPGLALANMYYQQENFVQSDAIFAELTDKFPMEASLRNNRAYTLKAMGCHQTALASAACAKKLAPEDQNILSTFEEMFSLEPATHDNCPKINCADK
jgi:tetratricopeptide (TPR) repeat protein